MEEFFFCRTLEEIFFFGSDIGRVESHFFWIPFLPDVALVGPKKV